MSIFGSVIFWGKCHFNLLYNIGGGLKKCYTVLRRVGGWSRIRFLHYIICERPFSARMLLAAYTLIHCRYTGRGRFRHVQHVRPNWGPTKRGPHKRTIFSIIWQHGRLLFATWLYTVRHACRPWQCRVKVVGGGVRSIHMLGPPHFFWTAAPFRVNPALYTGLSVLDTKHCKISSSQLALLALIVSDVK